MKSAFWFKSILLILGFSCMSSFSYFAASNNLSVHKPFRVAVVIGDQWEDPMSYMLTKPKVSGEYSGYGDQPDVSGPIEFYHLSYF